jgi:hypothetical protein
VEFTNIEIASGPELGGSAGTQRARWGRRDKKAQRAGRMTDGRPDAVENTEVARSWWSTVAAQSQSWGGAQRERWGLRDSSDDIEGRWDGRWTPRRRGERQSRHSCGGAVEGSRTTVVEECGRSAADAAGWTSGFDWRRVDERIRVLGHWLSRPTNESVRMRGKPDRHPTGSIFIRSGSISIIVVLLYTGVQAYISFEDFFRYLEFFRTVDGSRSSTRLKVGGTH